MWCFTSFFVILYLCLPILKNVFCLWIWKKKKKKKNITVQHRGGCRRFGSNKRIIIVFTCVIGRFRKQNARFTTAHSGGPRLHTRALDVHTYKHTHIQFIICAHIFIRAHTHVYTARKTPMCKHTSTSLRVCKGESFTRIVQGRFFQRESKWG